MWVESDTNMPGGEALARQFVHGKQFFLDEFGIETQEVWLPDSFGYTAALPQLIALSNSSWFLTQKISWNQTNRFPHHSFLWEGIDGTRVFTHFPPVDTYNSEISGAELAHAARNFAEKGRANRSLVPFGYGDGGGGPTREMLARVRRTRDLEGSPRVRIERPAEFFAAAEAEYPDAPVWVGELYLEFHRGTYTSQARTKQGNRRSEHLLREAELWATTATITRGTPYPYDELARNWKTVLLQQFHDILPGSSIALGAPAGRANYAAVAAELNALIADGRGGESVFDHRGLIASLVERATGREVVPAGERAGLLQLFRDTPTQWDAWDVDIEYRRSGLDLATADSVKVVEDTASRVAIRTVRTFGESTVVQTITVEAGRNTVDYDTHVDWHERQRMLKLAFPVDVHTSSARSEIQFGHIARPTHTNTSWDAARFETPAHRWVYVSDATFGVGVANDATYGHDITRHAREGGGTYSLVRQTLLRAPLFPDPEADQGEHLLRSSIVVGPIGDAIQNGYRLNLPLRRIAESPTNGSFAPLVSSDDPSVVIETVKLAEDGSGDVVVRLYESRGARARATVAVDFPIDAVVETDLLERETEASALVTSDAAGATVGLRPFQLLTLRFTRAASTRRS